MKQQAGQRKWNESCFLTFLWNASKKSLILDPRHQIFLVLHVFLPVSVQILIPFPLFFCRHFRFVVFYGKAADFNENMKYVCAYSHPPWVPFNLNLFHMWGSRHHKSYIFCPFLFIQEEQNRGKPNWEHLNDELHVLITVEDTENRCKVKLQRAKDEINKLLIPMVSGRKEVREKVWRRWLELSLWSCRRDGESLSSNPLLGRGLGLANLNLIFGFSDSLP